MRRLAVVVLLGLTTGCSALNGLNDSRIDSSQTLVTKVSTTWDTKLFEQPWLAPLSSSEGSFLMTRTQPNTEGKIPGQSLLIMDSDTMQIRSLIARAPGRDGKAQVRSGLISHGYAVWLETTSTQLSIDGWTIYSAKLNDDQRQVGPTKAIASAPLGERTPAAPGGTELSVDNTGNVWFSSAVRVHGKWQSIVTSVPVDGSKKPYSNTIGQGASARGNFLFYTDTRGPGARVVRRNLTTKREEVVLTLKQTGCSSFRDLTASSKGRAVVAFECGKKDKVVVLDAKPKKIRRIYLTRNPGSLRSAGSLVTFAEEHPKNEGSRPVVFDVESGRFKVLGAGYRLSDTVVDKDSVGWWRVSGEGKETTNRFSWARVSGFAATPAPST